MLRHSEYSPDGLRRELEALNLSEDKKHGSTGAIPAEGDGLLEKQYLGGVVGSVYHVEVVGLLSRQPNGELAICGVDAVSIESGDNLVFNFGIVGGQILAAVIGELNQQKRVNLHTELFISVGEFLALFQSKPNEVLVE